MIIKSRLKDYEVSFSHGFSFISELASLENRYVVVDSNVLELYGERLKPILGDSSRVLVFRSSERNKSAKKALELAEKVMELPSKRNTMLISIGGGIVQDVTGFAASVLYRGIKWVFVPTTLLAQTDSCIGSKTSLNHAGNKNLLGTFYPPDKIYVDTDFIRTLSRKDYLNGLGEIAKIAITRGADGISEFESDLPKLLSSDLPKLQEWIMKSLEVKKAFIEEDEFDRGRRKLLNYGHTFGHALEKTSAYSIPHGQGVSIGILIANRISASRGRIDTATETKIQKMVIPLIKVKIKKEFFSDDFIETIKKDKKRTGDSLPAILLRSDSSVLSLESVNDVREDEVKQAADYVFALLSGDLHASS